MNISLIDNQPVVAAGLSEALRPWRIRIAMSGPATWQKDFRTWKPRVVLLESRLGAADGLKLIEPIQSAGVPVPVIVYSQSDNTTFVARSVALGARDFVPRTAPLPQVVSAIRRVLDGRDAPAEGLFGQMQRYLAEVPVPRKKLPEMTGREYQVWRHVGLGLGNREIGRSLDISVETVKEHVQNLLRKLNAADRTQAAIQALRNGVAR